MTRPRAQQIGAGATSISRRHFVLSGLSAALVSACRGPAPRFGGAEQQRAVQALLRDPAVAQTTDLKILTWNIWMMPGWLHDSPRNLPRAAAIAAELLACDYDILCLQKVFDDASREILAGALGGRYPYRFGPANNACSVEANSGVWVLSRLPLVNYAEIEFEDCGGVECLSRKGAILLTGAAGKQLFHLVATHMQGEEGPGFSEKNDRIRQHQVEQIAAQLLTPNLGPGVPFFFCGDFNTRRHDGRASAESAVYAHLLRTLGAENGPEQRVTFDDTGANQLATEHTCTRAELDYILARPNGCAIEVKRALHMFRRSGWDAPGDRLDLSYRYAVGAHVRFPAGGAVALRSSLSP